ncbi:MAG: hypothetical protein ABI488_14975 [Polyangiaceae bacterium]
MLNIEHYFHLHHSTAETLDKIDPEQLKKSVGALATNSVVSHSALQEEIAQ